MALCRFVVFSSPPRPPLPRVFSRRPTSFVPNRPPKSAKFTSLLHPLQNSASGVSSCTLHSSLSSSMESAPEGYRRNVGVCLINSSKKVYMYVYMFYLLCKHVYLSGRFYVCIGLHSSVFCLLFLCLGRFLLRQG